VLCKGDAGVEREEGGGVISLLERAVWIKSAAIKIETVFITLLTVINRFNPNNAMYMDFSTPTSIMPIASACSTPHGRTAMDGKYSGHHCIHSSKDAKVRE